jgi:hypothetical protein
MPLLWLDAGRPMSDPVKALYSKACRQCPHPAGQHRWIKPTPGQGMPKLDRKKNNCHRCGCTGYDEASPA